MTCEAHKRTGLTIKDTDPAARVRGDADGLIAKGLDLLRQVERETADSRARIKVKTAIAAIQEGWRTQHG